MSACPGPRRRDARAGLPPSPLSSCVSINLTAAALSQSNARICNAMQHWVMGQLRGDSGRRQTDLLELYCGNGNFSLPLASIFRQVRECVSQSDK